MYYIQKKKRVPMLYESEPALMEELRALINSLEKDKNGEYIPIEISIGRINMHSTPSQAVAGDLKAEALQTDDSSIADLNTIAGSYNLIFANTSVLNLIKLQALKPYGANACHYVFEKLSHLSQQKYSNVRYVSAVIENNIPILTEIRKGTRDKFGRTPNQLKPRRPKDIPPRYTEYFRDEKGSVVWYDPELIPKEDGIYNAIYRPENRYEGEMRSTRIQNLKERK